MSIAKSTPKSTPKSPDSSPSIINGVYDMVYEVSSSHIGMSLVDVIRDSFIPAGGRMGNGDYSLSRSRRLQYLSLPNADQNDIQKNEYKR